MHKIICIFTFTLSLWSAGYCLANVKPLDQIAAIVNDNIITQSELSKQVELFRQNRLAEGAATTDHQALQKQVLEHLILQELQLQIAERSGIHIDDAMLNQVIHKIAQDNKLTYAEFIKKLEEEGIEYNLYRQTITKQLAIQQLQQRDIYNTIQISENELNQFLNAPSGLGAMAYEYHLGHILLPFSEAPTPEEIEQKQQQAAAVLKELKGGADFGAVALKTARGELALKGGDLGWRKLAELPTLFVNIVPGLQIGEFADPVKSASGLHIIKLMEKRQTKEMDKPISKYNVRHILVQTNDYISDNEAKTKLNVIKKQIENGQDFEHLAKTHSNDIASSMKGGNLGWVTQAVLVPEFTQVMESMPLQVVSEPFHSPFGWHILEVMDKKIVNDGENALKIRAKEMLQQRKFEEKLQAWQNQIRDEAFIKVYI